MCLPIELKDYLRDILSMVRNAVYNEDLENRYLEQLSRISFNARKNLIKNYKTKCNQKALENDLSELIKNPDEIKKFLSVPYPLFDNV